MYKVKRIERIDTYEEIKRLRDERNLFMTLSIIMTIAFCAVVQMAR